VEQLKAGKDPSEISIPSDVPSCKENLFRWLSTLVTEINSLPSSTITHCWESTQLSRAWDVAVQFEAVGRATELFPNLVRAHVVRPNMVQAAEIADEDEPEDSDADAHWAGQAAS
jgi:hypothetical protein